MFHAVCLWLALSRPLRRNLGGVDQDLNFWGSGKVKVRTEYARAGQVRPRAQDVTGVGRAAAAVRRELRG